MKVITGQTKAEIFVELIESLMGNNYFYKNNQKIFQELSGQLTSKYFEELFSKPIILYVRKGSIKESLEDENLEEYIGDIVWVDGQHIVLHLICMPKNELKDLYINWIICETSKEMVQIDSLDMGLFLNMLRNGQAKGSIDYHFLEKYSFPSLGCDLKEFIKQKTNKSNKFFSKLLGIDTKIQVTIKNEYKFFNFYDISEKGIFSEYNIFSYKCPICKQTQDVVMNYGQCVNKRIDKYIKITKDEENENEFIATFQCDHAKTKYRGKKQFSIRTVKYKNLPPNIKKDKDMIFLHMFFNYKSDGDTIMYMRPNEDGTFEENIFEKEKWPKKQ